MEPTDVAVWTTPTHDEGGLCTSIREISKARVEGFLKAQRVKAYSRAKHSKTLLRMVMNYALRPARPTATPWMARRDSASHPNGRRR